MLNTSRRSYGAILMTCSLLLLAPCALLAQSPKVGEKAPDFGVAPTWIINAPSENNPQNLMGEVCFVEFFGKRCPPCRALFPHLVATQTKYGSKGLHIFAFECQGTPVADVKELMAAAGCNYPVAAGGPRNYEGPGSIPFGWLIGVEGKVIWAGNPGSGEFDETLEAEMAKVKFPGLGLAVIHQSLEPAAALYARKEYGKARAAARKVLEREEKAGERGSAKALSDARYIVERIDSIGSGLKASAEKFESESEWYQAYVNYQSIKDVLKGEPEADDAAQAMKRIKGDRAAKDDLAAGEAWEKIRAKIEKASAEHQPALLRDYLKKHGETKTGARVRKAFHS